MSLIDNIKFNDSKTKSYFETLINEFKIDSKDFILQLQLEINNKCLDRETGNIRLTRINKLNAITTFMKNFFTDKLLFHNNKSYLFIKDNWRPFSKINIEVFYSFITELLFSLELNQTEIKNLSNSIIQNCTNDNLLLDNFTVQFGNCYFKDNELFDGFYSASFPRIRINRNFEKYGNKNCDVALDLLLHLCNNDKDTLEWLIERLAGSLILDTDFKSKNGQMVRFYGPSGENGKSTFSKFLRKVFGKENVYSTLLGNIDKNNNYNLKAIINSLFVIDEDGNENYYSSKTMGLQKMIITGETMEVREIYKKPEQITPICNLIVMSNHRYSSDDKTNGADRRITEIKTSNKLVRPNEWFVNLFSEKECQAFFNFIVNKALEISKRKHRLLKEDTPYIIKQKDILRHNNNNVLEFIDEYSDEIEGYSVKEVRQKYELWCDSNCENVFGTTKFNETISSKLGLVSTPIKLSSVSQKFLKGEAYDRCVLESNLKNITIRCWIKE